MDASLTVHARARMQQRGIRADALDRLFEFGREAFDHRGNLVLYFDKAARRRLERERRMAPGASGHAVPADLERAARCYAVVSGEGTVVTVGHRYRRINRG